MWLIKQKFSILINSVGKFLFDVTFAQVRMSRLLGRKIKMVVHLQDSKIQSLNSYYFVFIIQSAFFSRSYYF